ncbi:MAG TPA: sigma factor, partial [Bacillota bacterium]|nr:sigma factor [Bacillota bacterium]
MEDFQIVNMYWSRSEYAISETDKKYGRMLYGVSFSLISSHEDADECVNDTYLKAWNSMPEERP